MLKMALWLLKAKLEEWLTTRALVPPADKRKEICIRANITDAQLTLVSQALGSYAASRVGDSIK